ncbi:MAG: KamA family radical SAM protein [Candidatus Hydrothermales bacterium]
METKREEKNKETLRGEEPPPLAALSVDTEEKYFWQRYPLYRDIPPEVFYDWKWQIKNLIRTPEKLFEAFPFLSEKEKREIRLVARSYPILISPYYLSLIDPDNPDDPIRKQAIPTILEIKDKTGVRDPLEEEEDEAAPGLIHRYPDRALLITTNFCTTYCRHCTRKRLLGKGGTVRVYNEFNKVTDYLSKHPEINEIILSGGDPLTLPLLKLKFILDELSKVPTIQIVRIGSRVPVTLPMRLFDEELLKLLSSYDFLWLNTHFNHPNEITELSKKAVLNLLKCGIPVNNQTVLLKGVNDNVEIMRELLKGLLRIKVRPYYLFHCDPTKGVSHFRTSVYKGIEIMEALKGHISGLAIPTYVVDAPHGGGKIPIMPNYIISLSDNKIILRNYEGMIVSYSWNNEEKEENLNSFVKEGVYGLIKGEGKYLVPEGLNRIERRRSRK